MTEQIMAAFARYHIPITQQQADQLALFYTFLMQENEKYNLTAIREPAQVIEKHFIDSVLPIGYLPANASGIDIGSGAGFPGIPLKILRPDLKLVLLDSLQKRVHFLQEAIALLRLKDIKAVHERAETYVDGHREAFSFAVSRAVAATPTLLEYMLPYVQNGGQAILYKSRKAISELEAASHALQILGGSVSETIENVLMQEEARRVIVIVKKVRPTPPQYPRGKNLPKLKPL